MAVSKRELPFRYNMVDGLMVSPIVTQRRVDEVKRLLKLSEGDLVINSYQKSGTTWVQHIMKLLRNDGKDDGKIIPQAIPWLEFDAPDSESPYHIPIESLQKPVYLKSHMPYELCLGALPHTSKAKYIYIARNPKDVAVSYFHHMRAMKSREYSGSWDNWFQLYLGGSVPFGSWFDHVLGWWKYRDAENVLFLKYEDLCSNLRKEVQKIAWFVFDEIPQEIILEAVVHQCCFDSMKSNPAANFSWNDKVRNLHEDPFMRKGKVGDWRNYFTPEQNAVFDALYAEQMKGTGLEFEF